VIFKPSPAQVSGLNNRSGAGPRQRASAPPGRAGPAARRPAGRRTL